MYPVKRGYDEAKLQIENLLKQGYCSEALTTTAFTVEKTLRRTLRQIIISAGFRSKDADKLMKNFRGLDSIKRHWDIFDPHGRTLSSLTHGGDWSTIKRSAEMRNKLVHGERVYGLDECRTQSSKTIEALDRLISMFDETYGYSGWSVVKRRVNSVLHTDPKVKLEF